MLTTQHEVRRSFWATHPQYQGLRKPRQFKQNDYPADVRMAFVDFVDSLARDGQISEALAERVTL